MLAGCGSQAKTVEVKKKVAPSPRKVLLASIRTTAAAKSARVSMSMVAGFGAERFSVTADGLTDFITGDGELTMHFTGAASQLSRGDTEMRTVDGVVYMHRPESPGNALGGGKWLKTLDLGNPGFPGVGQSNPSQFLAYLETVSDGVKKVGSEAIRGVVTTHYKASIDLGKAFDASDAPPTLRDDLRDVFERVSRSTPPMPADVWVDGNGLARRVKIEMDLGALLGDGAGDGAPTMSMSMDLYDFGVPVHVVAPSADETTDLGSALNGPAS